MIIESVCESLTVRGFSGLPQDDVLVVRLDYLSGIEAGRSPTKSKAQNCAIVAI